MIERASDRRVELPVLCKYLRCKSGYGAVEDSTDWQLGTSTTETYWCLATMEAFGPDDGDRTSPQDDGGGDAGGDGREHA